MDADFGRLTEPFCEHVLAVHDKHTLGQQQAELKQSKNDVGVYKAAAAVEYAISFTPPVRAGRQH